MKHTGIVRRIDDLGRIVIPKEIRRTYKIEEGDALEISTDGKYICFSKYTPVDISTESLFAKNLYECCKLLYGSFDVELRSTDKSLVYGNIPSNERCREIPININGYLIGYLLVSIYAINQDNKVNKLAEILYQSV
jgi:AbrB family looped-hinge helix DNA binding protein